MILVPNESREGNEMQDARGNMKKYEMMLMNVDKQHRDYYQEMIMQRSNKL